MKCNWEYKKLGECGIVITGNTPSKRDAANYSSNDFCFVKPNDIEKDGITYINQTCEYISKKAFERSRRLSKGAVLTTCIGIIGKVAILEVDATCNQQINAIIPNADIDSKFLAYSILSIRNYLTQKANAPVVPIINKGDFSDILIPVPPLEEQSRIVAELDLLTGIIDKQNAQLKELDNLAQAIFYDMFGDPIENPKGWDVKKWDGAFRLKSGDNLTAKDFINGEYPVYGGNGISGYHNAYNKEGSFIIVGRVGAYCGNVRFVQGKFWLTDNAFEVFFDKSSFDFNFLCSMLNAYDLHRYANQAAQPVISNAGLKDIDVILPPLALQQSFAEKIQSIEKQKETIRASIADTQKLLDYTMDKYFG